MIFNKHIIQIIEFKYYNVTTQPYFEHKIIWHDSGIIDKQIKKWPKKILFCPKRTKQTEFQNLRNKEGGVLKMANPELIEIFSHIIEPLQRFFLGVGLIFLYLDIYQGQ